METRSIPIDLPLDLRRTLGPLHGYFADDGWWLPLRTPEGPGTLRVRRTREELIGQAWGDGAGWLLGRLAAICGLEDEPSVFQPEHPLVGRLHHENPGLRFGRTGRVFDGLVHAVCGQKVTGREASAAMSALRRLFSDPAPGPRSLRLPPDPTKLARARYWHLHEAHLERRRAEVLIGLATEHSRLAALADAPPGDVARALLAYPGVGPWTVARAIEISHGDPDQVAVGDFHFKHMIVHHLTGRNRGTDEEMLTLLEPFRPHRGRVIRLLSLLGPEPSFGPRLAPRDITAL